MGCRGIYPAAALLGWALRHRGYKRPRTPEVLAAVAGIAWRRLRGWAAGQPHEETIKRSHDAFDAVIATLTARSDPGQTWPLDEEHPPAVRIEGWIAIPSWPISQLFSDRL